MLTYRIKGPWSGELAIIPRPRGGDWLQDEARTLRDAGFDVVVSLLTAAEARELGLTAEVTMIENQCIRFCNYPIPDLGVPNSRESAREFVDQLHGELLAGKKIAIHCRGSIGRSGLIAASILVISGIDPAQAIRDVSEARGLDSPETDEQRAWIRAWSLQPAGSAA